MITEVSTPSPCAPGVSSLPRGVAPGAGRYCYWCYTVFNPKSNRARFCSKRCADKHYHYYNVILLRPPSPPLPTEKRCSSCGVVKPLDHFYKEPLNKVMAKETCKDGHRSWCKRCWCVKNDKQNKKWKERNQTRFSVIKRRNADIYKMKHGNATRKVYKEVKRGNLIKPLNCSICGAEKPLDAHHDDYKKPLIVRWVCRVCHHQIHGRRKWN